MRLRNTLGQLIRIFLSQKNFEAYRELAPIFIRLSRQLQTEYQNIANYQRKHSK